MDHAEVRAWLDDAFFARQPGDGNDTRSQSVDEHIASCADCRAYATALGRTALKLDLARGPSPAARERVLEAVRSVGRPKGRTSVAAGTSWWQRLGGVRLAVAALLIGIIGVGLGVMWGQALRPAAPNAERLVAAVEMMARLAGQDATHEMVLRDHSGQEAGMALMSDETHQMAIFTAALNEPTEDEYWCFLERDGERMMLGPMHFAEGVSFWAGPMAEDAEMQPGDQLVVAADEDAPAMLSAPL